jgi:hypothetical protein
MGNYFLSGVISWLNANVGYTNLGCHFRCDKKYELLLETIEDVFL